MKKLIFIGLSLILGLQFAHAQSYDINRTEKNKGYAQQLKQPYIDWAIQTMEDANKMLSLTEEQKDEVVYINLMYAKRMEILADKGTSPENLKQHKTDMVTMAVNDYSRVLNESQQAILNDKKAAFIEHSAE